MKKLIALFFLLLTCLCLAEDNKKPFAPLLEHIEKQGGHWALNNTEVAKVFQECRKKSGPDFQKDLISFVGNDLTRHYWCASYLSTPSYLHGAQSDNNLALILFAQASELANRVDPNARDATHKITTNYCAAVLCYKMDLVYLAQSYKRKVENTIEKHPQIAGAFPCMSKEEHEMYDKIEVPQ